jgi:LuxR family maltose regulon positive regulatory protein
MSDRSDVKLILVSAPAGFGKTTLIANWIDDLHKKIPEQPVCWVSLDEQDQLLSRFWLYVIGALQTAVPHLAGIPIANTAKSSLQSERQTPIEPILVSLLNELAISAQSIILVLDDLHIITNPAIYQSLDFFLDHQPPNLQLAVMTREDPPLRLSRLRVRGQLCEIRAADLCFSAAETAVFLNNLNHLDCSEEAVTTLAQRTEGWIAGLQLAALALQATETNNLSDFVRTFSGSDRLLTDYLIDEVLSQQEPTVHQFLLRTSILRQFNAGLCDALLAVGTQHLDGDESPITLLHSQTILNDLERANLFLVLLDNRRQWYRYHHLFAQFLQQRLRESEPEILPALYQTAAHWLAQHDQPREAIQYALKTDDFTLIADLIEKLAPHILEREDAAIVQSWIERLPATFVAKRPFLNMYYAWALTITGAKGDINSYLETAVSLSQDASPADKQTINGIVAAHRAYAAMFAGKHETAQNFAQEALASLSSDWPSLRARTAVVLGNSYNYGGRLKAAIRAYKDAIVWSEEIGDVANATFNLCSLAEIYFDQNRLTRTAQTYQQALDFAQRHTGSTDNPFSGFAHFARGRILRERNELETAVLQMQHGVALCREWQQAYSLAIGLLDLSIVWTAMAEWERARHVLQEARLLAQKVSPEWGGGMVDGLSARLALAQGDVETAAQWALNCPFGPHDEPSYELTIICFTRARVLIAQNQTDDALTLLKKLEQLHQSVGRKRLVMEALIWQAKTLAVQGNTTEAMAQLKSALKLAEPEGYVRVFIDAGQPIADLLAQFSPSSFQQKLLAAFSVETAVTDQTQSLSTTSYPGLLDPLNERELAILRLMAVGLSNRDIGDELYLSVNTIRWYASQIYSKIGVSNRTQAVARARELGILNTATA